jgi:hypothetical protein
MNTASAGILVLSLLLGAGTAPARASGGEILIVHESTARFVGTVLSVAPFEDFTGPAIPLDVELRLVVRVHVDRWLDEPALEVEDGTLALLIDDLHTWFPQRPFIGKSHLFTLTTTFSPGGPAYKLEVGKR